MYRGKDEIGIKEISILTEFASIIYIDGRQNLALFTPCQNL